MHLPSPPSEPVQISLQGPTMGASYEVKYVSSQHTRSIPSPEAIKAQVEALLDTVNQQMSVFQEDSQISRFNRWRKLGVPFTIDEDFATVVAESLRLHKITRGALDISMAPLINLWGFGPTRSKYASAHALPTAAEIAACADQVGIDKLSLLRNAAQAPALSKSVAGLALDLSAIAKGFAVDKIAEYLDTLAIKNYLVGISGELRAKGCNLAGQPWRIAIEQPIHRHQNPAQVVLPLYNSAIATSGDYRHYFLDQQGQRYAHIIDPVKQQPRASTLASISVLADSAMTADGLATGLYILGTDEALDIAEQEQLAVFCIANQHGELSTRMSSRFQALLAGHELPRRW